MRHLPTAIVTTALLLVSQAQFLGAAQGAPAVLDRSQLSLDENVLINRICGVVRSQGGQGAYDGCVTQQLAGLTAHPSPDRSGLSHEQSLALERACDYVKRVGIGDYNACLDKTLAAQKAAGKLDDTPEGSLAQVFAPVGPAGASPGDKTSSDEASPVKTASAAAAAADKLPRPQDVLASRPAATERSVLAPTDLFKTVAKSVFVVLVSPSLADARAGHIAQGSAVAVSENLLLTNCHVVLNEGVIKIIQDQTRDDATLVAADPKADRCVIKASRLKLSPVAGVSAFDSLTVGERAFAVGAPLATFVANFEGARSLDLTLSEGLVSSLHRQSLRNTVQTSAPISPGSSGGGLFDERGNLIGITTMTLNGLATQNMNLAIAAADYWN